MPARMSPDASTTTDQRYAAFRHSAFLRFWLARLSYEQEAQAARLAEVVDAAGRREVS